RRLHAGRRGGPPPHVPLPGVPRTLRGRPVGEVTAPPRGRRGPRPEVLLPPARLPPLPPRHGDPGGPLGRAQGPRREAQPRLGRLGGRRRLRMVRPQRPLVRPPQAPRPAPPGPPAPLRALRGLAETTEDRRRGPGDLRQPPLQRPDPGDDGLARREGRQRPTLC